MDEHGGREHGRAWRPRAWKSMEAVSMGAASARRGRMGAVSFMTIPTSCAAGRALGKTGQDWASLGAGDQANSERSSGACVGTFPPWQFRGNKSLQRIWRKELSQGMFARGLARLPGAGSTTCSSDLAWRAVPCHVVVGGEGVSLLFMSTFWAIRGSTWGSTCFFGTLCGLHQPRGRVPDGAQEVHQRYCCRADTAAPILPRRYCHADTAARTQPADAACLGASVAGVLHWWDTLRYLAIPCDTLRCRGIPCDALGYLVRHPAEACAWLCVGGVHRPCPTPGSCPTPAFACYACLLEP